MFAGKWRQQRQRQQEVRQEVPDARGVSEHEEVLLGQGKETGAATEVCLLDSPDCCSCVRGSVRVMLARFLV